MRIQRRLGTQKFPLIDQSFYPNYREMISNLWVSRQMSHSDVKRHQLEIEKNVKILNFKNVRHKEE